MDKQERTEINDKLAKHRQARIELAWKNVLNDRDGRMIIYYILQRCGYGSSALADDPHITAANAGMQKISEDIMRDLNKHSPDSFFQMVKEAREDVEIEKKYLEQLIKGTEND